MSETAQPMCGTCAVHNEHSKRVNFMWGAGWAFVVVIGTIVAIVMIGQAVNRENIADNSKKIALHERRMDNSLHTVERTLTIMSINQKKHMREDGVDYIDPEPIQYFDIGEDQ